MKRWPIYVFLMEARFDTFAAALGGKEWYGLCDGLANEL